MKNLFFKNSIVKYISIVMSCSILLGSCTTNDVEDDIPDNVSSRVFAFTDLDTKLTNFQNDAEIFGMVNVQPAEFRDLSIFTNGRTWTFTEGFADIIGSANDVTSNQKDVAIIFKRAGEFEAKLTIDPSDNNEEVEEIIPVTILPRVDGKITSRPEAENDIITVEANKSLRIFPSNVGNPDINDYTITNLETGEVISDSLRTTIGNRNGAVFSLSDLGRYELEYQATNERFEVTEFSKRTIVVVDEIPLADGQITFSNFGGTKDPIKLSADGTKIKIRYEEEIADISVVSPVDFNLTIDESVAELPMPITISSVTVDSGSNILLTLSSGIPSFLMDSVLLDLTSDSLMTNLGSQIVGFEGEKVFQTGKNIFSVDSSGDDIGSFESTLQWSNSNPEFGFSEPILTNSEIEFSNSLSLFGERSILFNTTSNPQGLGMTIVEDDHGLTVEEAGLYEVSFWYFVEKSEDPSTLDFFYLDNFTTFASGNLSEATQGRWIKANGTRELDAGFTLRTTIRVLGNSIVYIDALDVRLVDDGR